MGKRFDEDEVPVKIYKEWLPDKFHKKRVNLQRRKNKETRKKMNRELRAKKDQMKSDSDGEFSEIDEGKTKIDSDNEVDKTLGSDQNEVKSKIQNGAQKE